MLQSLCKRLYSSVGGQLHVVGRDTIFAVSSGHGKCGVSVLRISGEATREALLALSGHHRVPKPRLAHLTTFKDPRTAEPLDKGLLLWFPGPKSFTGEDVAELHIHGSTAVLSAMLSALGALPGLRHAEPGEFTKRSFFNGKFDLTEVEGLGDLIHAETEEQRRQALRQMEGSLSEMYHGWSHTILKCLADVEAVIDFAEDEGIEDGVLERAHDRVQQVAGEMDRHLKDGRRGERLRQGLRVAILGAPNAGKSSLLNLMCQKPKAIVSPVAGTTRDIVESVIDIAGYPVVLSDTAGLRSTEDPVEQEGVRRALLNAESADLKLVVVDSSEVADWTVLDRGCTDSVARSLLSGPSAACLPGQEFTGEDTIIVLNKTDLRPPPEARLGNVVALSCTRGQGVSGFLKLMQGYLESMCGRPGSGNPSLTQARHRHHLTLCLEALHDFTSATGEEAGLVWAAESLRRALAEIGHITGKVRVEDVLDVIFKDFCIGK